VTDDALAELVRAAVRAEVEPLRRLVEALQRPVADDTAQRACEAIVTTYGTGVAFYAVDLVDFAQAQPVLRRDLAESLRRLCKSDRLPSPQSLGMALRGLLARPPAGFVVEGVDVRGTVQWRVQDLRPRVPPAPQ
jgi:hypothetical protein